jgi:hypothetical protein
MFIVSLIGISVFALSVYMLFEAIRGLAVAIRSGLADVASAMRESGKTDIR